MTSRCTCKGIKGESVDNATFSLSPLQWNTMHRAWKRTRILKSFTTRSLLQIFSMNFVEWHSSIYKSDREFMKYYASRTLYAMVIFIFLPFFLFLEKKKRYAIQRTDIHFSYKKWRRLQWRRYTMWLETRTEAGYCVT